MLIKLCYFVTVFTLGGVVLSIANGNPAQEWLAQAFIGFSVALLLRRAHEIREAKKRVASTSENPSGTHPENPSNTPR